MLGKTAGSLFWMARYLERSENNARLIDAGFRIALTRSATAPAEWKSVLETAGVADAYMASNADFTSAHVVDFLLRDPANPSSIVSIVKQARDNARTRSEEHTSELQSLMRISHTVFCLNKKKK